MYCVSLLSRLQLWPSWAIVNQTTPCSVSKEISHNRRVIINITFIVHTDSSLKVELAAVILSQSDFSFVIKSCTHKAKFPADKVVAMYLHNAAAIGGALYTDRVVHITSGNWFNWARNGIYTMLFEFNVLVSYVCSDCHTEACTFMHAT